MGTSSYLVMRPGRGARQLLGHTKVGIVAPTSQLRQNVHIRGIVLRRLLIFFAVLLGSPAMAQSGWFDITKEVEKVIGRKTPETTYYLKRNSVRTVKSVNLAGVNYREAIFSFAGSGTTSRQTYSFNCPQYSYKLNSQAPGYWFDLEWIVPGHDKSTFSWFAFKYLCGGKADPWSFVSEGLDREKLYLNYKAAYALNFSKHGKVYTFVGVFIRPKKGSEDSGKYQGLIQWPEMPKLQDASSLDSDTAIRRVYVACSTKSLGIYSLVDAAGDEGITLNEANPGSVASGILQAVCR